MKQRHDHYFKKARAEDYLARSIYKLEEIHQKYQLFQQNLKAIDLGCTPGSWTQYLLKFKGGSGIIVGVDINPMDESLQSQIHFLHSDVYTLEIAKLLEISPVYDILVSDMAPNTMGIKSVDHLRSIALCERSLEIACQVLKPGGDYLVKVFQGADFSNFHKLVREYFVKTHIVKPKASRKESKEIYILGKGLKSPAGKETPAAETEV